MNVEHHGRQRGTPNVKPGKKAVRGYWKMLRERADAGDVMAAAELIRLTEGAQNNG